MRWRAMPPSPPPSGIAASPGIICGGCDHCRSLPLNVCAMGHLDSQRSLPAVTPDRLGFSSMAKKLRLAPQHRVAVLNAPDGYIAQLSPGPSDVTTNLRPDQEYDAVLLFVKDVQALRRLGPAALRPAKSNGLLWISYPKGGQAFGVTDLPAPPWCVRREVPLEVTSEAGFRAVAVVAIDDYWTALHVQLAEEEPLRNISGGDEGDVAADCD